MTQFKRKQETEINPAEIWEDDAFGTLKSHATFLTNALVADHGNFVLNVNGAWGTGKTFFVNRWAEQLRQAGHPVVEFNAWENDSEIDPLVPFVAECSESLKEHFTEDQNIIEGFKEKGGRIALQLGGIATKAVLRKALGNDGVEDVCNLFSEDTEKDLIKLGGSLVEEQVKKKHEREAFTLELKSLVTKLNEAGKTLPVFIFIDELDRCRPTFAIELLERVKHLFHVDGIKFIISTDSTQLVHSIQGVYGANFDSHSYLRRFSDETFTLPNPDSIQFARSCLSSLEQGNWTNNFADGYLFPDEVFGGLSSAFSLTLRDQAQIFHRMNAILANIPNGQQVLLMPLCFLTILRMKDPVRYSQLIRTKDKYINWQEVEAKLVFENEQLRIQLDAYFKYTAMDFDSALKKFKGPITIQNSRDRTEKERNEIRAHGIVLDNFNSFKPYPTLIELTHTLS